MKKKFTFCLLATSTFFFLRKESKAQSDVAGITGHTGLLATWYVGWNAATAFPLNIRHNGNFPINFFTNNIQKATITNNFSLGTTTIIPGVGTGDGLRITPRTSGCGIPSTPDASLDLWTGCSNETHIRWDNSGQISGLHSRFEIWSNINGFYFNADHTAPFQPRYLFNTDETEHARVGYPNLFWRIGLNPTSTDPARRLEVADNITQFRLSRNDNTAFTDMTTTFPGDLDLQPTASTGALRFVGIHTAVPTQRLDVNGNARIRGLNVGINSGIVTHETDGTLHTLAFTGDPTDVLLGDGTWGPAAPTVSANNGATINPAGNVQWGQPGTGTGTLSGGELVHDTEIPFNNFNVYFSDAIAPLAGKNRIQFGDYTPPAFPLDPFRFAELSSIRDEDNPGLRVGVLGSTSNTAIDFPSLPNEFNPFYFGNTSTVTQRMGVVGIAYENATGGSRFIGLSGGAFNSTSVINVGVSGKGYDSPELNYGGRFFSGSNNTTSINYGIYAFASGGSVNAAAFFDGDINGTGFFNYTSDSSLKTNIHPLENASAILAHLHSKTFEFRTAEYPQMNLRSGTQMGLIAQDVEAILPQLVTQSAFPAQYDSIGTVVHPRVDYKSLNYDGIIPVLVAGHQEQQQKIDSLLHTNYDSIISVLSEKNHEQDSVIGSLNNRLSQLEDCLSALNLCNDTRSIQQSTNGINNSTGNIIHVELKDTRSIVLDQNVPNPFAEQTTISYSLPTDVKRAQILFYNVDGKLINSVELTERGKGQLNVFANDLSNGIYTYTLVVDEQIKDTKRMVKNK